MVKSWYLSSEPQQWVKIPTFKSQRIWWIPNGINGIAACSTPFDAIRWNANKPWACAILIAQIRGQERDSQPYHLGMHGRSLGLQQRSGRRWECSARAIRCYTKNRGNSRVFCLGTKMGEQFKAGFHEEHISVWDISVWKNLVKCKDHDTLISSWCSAFLASRFSGTKKIKLILTYIDSYGADRNLLGWIHRHPPRSKNGWNHRTGRPVPVAIFSREILDSNWVRLKNCILYIMYIEIWV